METRFRCRIVPALSKREGAPWKRPFFFVAQGGKKRRNVATKRAFRDASCIPITRDVSSHEASPGTRRRLRGTSALALWEGRPRSGRSARFPARSRPCCSCRPEASRSGAEAEKGGVRCFSVRRENANFTKTHLFVANALRSQNRAFQEKRVNVQKKALHR